MWTIPALDYLLYSGLIFLVLGFFTTKSCIRCLKSGSPWKGSRRGLYSIILLSLSGALLTSYTGFQGYVLLLKEEHVLRVEIEPVNKERFSVELTFPDGQKNAYMIHGDQLYIDAKIIKLLPAANLIGFHTLYELDRIGGRYRALGDELEKTRSLFSLAKEKPMDMYQTIEDFPILRKFFDAEYGSATFVDVTRKQVFELKLSTSGLLLRPAER